MFYVDLFRALAQHKVRYVLVGGLALNLHGVERATMDVDLAIALDEANLAAALDVAEALELVPVAPVALREAAHPATLERWRRDKNMIAFGLRPQSGTGPVVDLLMKLPFPFESLLQRAISRTVGDVTVTVACVDDLIAMKKAAGRPLDLADVASLESLKRLGLDQ
jgi:hypothetical protein